MNGKVTRLNVRESSPRRTRYMNDGQITIFMTYEEMSAGWAETTRKIDNEMVECDILGNLGREERP